LLLSFFFGALASKFICTASCYRKLAKVQIKEPKNPERILKKYHGPYSTRHKGSHPFRGKKCVSSAPCALHIDFGIMGEYDRP